MKIDRNLPNLHKRHKFKTVYYRLYQCCEKMVLFSKADNYTERSYAHIMNQYHEQV